MLCFPNEHKFTQSHLSWCQNIKYYDHRFSFFFLILQNSFVQSFFPSKSSVCVFFFISYLSLGWQSPWATVAALISNAKALGMMCHIRWVSMLVTFTALIIYMIHLTAPAKGHWITINGLTGTKLFIYYKVFNCIFSCRSIIKTLLFHIWPLHWLSPLCLLPVPEAFGEDFKV